MSADHEIRIPGSKIYFNDANQDGFFSACKCSSGSIDTNCDHYLDKAEFTTVCPENQAVQTALQNIGVPKLYGKVEDLKELIILADQLKNSANSSVRVDAASKLGKIKNKSAVPLLISVFQTARDQSLRNAAARALGSIGDQSAGQTLLSALPINDDDPGSGIIEALGELKYQPAAPVLLEMLNAGIEDYWIKTAVIDALGELKYKPAVEAIETILKRPVSVANDRAPRVTAVRALGVIGDKKSVPTLMDAMGSNERCVMRQVAAGALAQIGETSAIPHINQVIKDCLGSGKGHTDCDVVSLMNGMEAGSPKVVVPVYLEALGSEDVDKNLRLWAAVYLATQGEKTSKPVFQRLLRDSDDEKIRETAAIFLGTFHDKSSKPELIKALKNDASARVREGTAIALAEIGDKTAIPEIESAIEKEREILTKFRMQRDLMCLKFPTLCR
jgi:HEAT repeat protein